MSEQLSGRELDKAIAEAMGWTDIEENEYWVEDTRYGIYDRFDGYKGKSPKGNVYPIADYHADANAVIAVCAERGWALSYDPDGAVISVLGVEPADTRDYVSLRADSDEKWSVSGARALLAALTAETGSAG